MEKLAATEVLRKIALGEVDLDAISEVIRAAELVIKNYQAEVEGLHRRGEQLQLDFDKERSAVDDLTRRLVTLHEDNRMAREVFQTEIEGKREVLGLTAGRLDLEVLGMEGLIREREKVQQQVGKVLGAGGMV